MAPAPDGMPTISSVSSPPLPGLGEHPFGASKATSNALKRPLIFVEAISSAAPPPAPSCGADASSASAVPDTVAVRHPHAPTSAEAKEAWRNEGNPN